MAAAKKKAQQAKVRATVPAVPARLVPAVPLRSFSTRLAAFLREAERDGRGVQAEAINAVIVALSDAKHKAQVARRLVAGAGLTTLMDEIGAL